MATIQENLQSLISGLKTGIERVKQSDPRDYFLPTAIFQPEVKQELAGAGKILQKFPDTTIRTPVAEGIGMNRLTKPLRQKAQEFITSMPGEIVRSYGRTAEKLTTSQKLGLEDYLNMSDFIPGIGIIGGGVKFAGKKVISELSENTGRKAIGEVVERAGKAASTLTKEPLPMDELSYLAKKVGMDVKKKVSIFDYLKTPEKVLEKIGLNKERQILRTGYDNYQSQLREEMLRLKSWKEKAPRKGSAQKIFDYLDGTLEPKALEPNELGVANEVKTYLKGWADKLGLPEEKRIEDYITHLFEKTQEGSEFPVEIARQIRDQAAGSVYDPFLMQRTGKPEYIRDVWRALEAYVKRGTRKVNLDPALDMLKKASETLDPATENYIKKYSHQINLRPTDLDELLDNAIKQSPIGYRFTARPTAYLTNKWRQTVFRGALGLNVGSAMRNLTQGVNTYAKIGEKYTTLGYADAIKHMATGDMDELIKHNILSDNIIVDREYHVAKRIAEKADDVLFSLFNFAEKINRGSAYFGAKKKAIAEGKSIPEAIDFAKKIVRETQFNYGAIDQPVGLGSDLAKTFTQFLSYPIKQTEFLADLVKSKKFAGVLRYIAGSLVLTATYGKIMGMDLKEFVPFSNAKFTSPAGEVVGGALGAVSGNERRREEGLNKLANALTLLIPAGVQLKKTLQGGVAAARGYTATPTGRAKYPINQDMLSALQVLLFGQYAPQTAKEYYGKGRSPLGTEQTEKFQRYGLPYYEKVMREREAKQEVK